MTARLLGSAIVIVTTLSRPSGLPVVAGAEANTTENESTAPDAVLRITRDFGLVDQGPVVVREFSVKNVSAGALRFEDFRLSCGCLSIADQPRAIAANEIGTVALKLDTTGLRGRVSQSVSFKVIHRKYRYVQLVLEGTVRGVWVEPSTIDLGSLTTASRPEARFFVVASGRPDVKFTEAYSDDCEIEVTKGNATTPNTALARDVRAVGAVTVKWGGGARKPGPYLGKIIVRLGDDQDAQLTVPITAHVTGAMDATPPRLVFGRVAPGSTVRRECRLRLGCSGESVDLGELTFQADHGQVACDVTRREPTLEGSGTLRVTLTAAKIDRGQLLKGTVVAMRDGKVILSIPYVAFLAAD